MKQGKRYVLCIITYMQAKKVRGDFWVLDDSRPGTWVSRWVSGYISTHVIFWDGVLFLEYEVFANGSLVTIDR